MSKWYTVLVNVLSFFDLTSDGPNPRLSASKLAFWVSTILNTITLLSQTDWRIIAGTSAFNIAAAVKHEYSKSQIPNALIGAEE